MKNLLLLAVLLFLGCGLTPTPTTTVLPTPGFALCDVTSTTYVKVHGTDGEHLGNVFPSFNAFCFKADSNVIFVPLGDTITIDPISSWDTIGFNDGIYEILFVNTSIVECERMH